MFVRKRSLHLKDPIIINNQSCTYCHTVRFELSQSQSIRGDSISQVSYFGHKKDDKSCSSTVAMRNTK